MLQSLGYFLPAAYLPSYATQELALPPRTGALLLALLNATSVPGGILIGALCDRVRDAKGTRRVLLVSALPSAGAVLLFWGLAGPRGGGGSSSIDSTGTHADGPTSPLTLLFSFPLLFIFSVEQRLASKHC